MLSFFPDKRRVVTTQLRKNLMLKLANGEEVETNIWTGERLQGQKSQQGSGRGGRQGCFPSYWIGSLGTGDARVTNLWIQTEEVSLRAKVSWFCIQNANIISEKGSK